ncbi:hypothetical protein PYW08_006609 [Mythimna loreyi]|uniref:Uncharacterized protein n=1 Tax=Mythimna loreyi TaxID=667449 RepID=A0ACC2R8P6_9NEOP|nr:hypothetical protein PYW08_006609 [Mythimna loreyi]
MMHSPKSNKCQSVPNLHSEKDAEPNVTQRNPKRKELDCELKRSISALSDEFKKSMSTLSSEIRDQFSNINSNIVNLRNEVNNLATTSSQIQSELTDLHSDFSNTKKVLSILNTKHLELSKVVDDLKSSVEFNYTNNSDAMKRVKEMESKIVSPTSEPISILISKLDRLEQQARQCNIEIGNLPEKRGENLLVILESIAAVINIPITQRDIVAIHLIPHAHTHNSRPKNVIVKFTSRLLRDNVLSAFRLAKGITSDRVGLAGTPCRIYMNEHLTLRYKELFRKCRDAAKTSKFRNVWVRNATVLVKENNNENDDSPTIAVRSEDDIFKSKK